MPGGIAVLLDRAPAISIASTTTYYILSDVDLNNPNVNSILSKVNLAATQATASAINAKTTNLPASPAGVGAAMSLTGATTSAIRSGLATQSKSTAIYATMATQSTAAAIKAKTDNLPAQPAAVGSQMTLTSAYDAAKTAAQAGNAMSLTSAAQANLASAVVAKDEIIRIMSAVSRSFTRSGNVYTFLNATGSKVFTMTIASNGGTVS